MAFATDDTIQKFGTLDDLDSTSASVASATFSIAGDMATWTNDSVDADAMSATAVFIGTYATAPNAGSVVQLHMQKMNIADTTKDEQVPSATYSGAWVGSFKLDSSSTAEQIIPIGIVLPNVKAAQLFQPFIKNEGGQTISAGWSVQITPKAAGPKA